MILMVVFYTAEDTLLPEGMTYNFWAGGHMVYMNCVILANLIIIRMSHDIHLYNLFLIGAQIGCFFVLLWYFQYTLQTDPLYKFMDEFVASPTAWIGSFFCVCSFWTIDKMLSELRNGYRYLFGIDAEQEKKITEEDVRHPSHVYNSASRSVSAIRQKIDQV